VTATFKAPASVLDELGITEPSRIRIEGIAQHCGATILYEPLDGCEARILGRDDHAIITVNSNASRARQRFSAAHELGHWMRDRGKVAFSCTEQKLLREWGDDNPERRANRYAADLLLPRKMFEGHARGLPAVFTSARSLAQTFETSLTATAIRLVDIGSFPSMILCTEATGRRWFFSSPILPSEIRPLSKPGPGAVATRLLMAKGNATGPESVDADDWIDHVDASRYSLIEDSIPMSGGLVLTLLWWKDEAQILALDDDEDGQRARSDVPSFGRRTRRR